MFQRAVLAVAVAVVLLAPARAADKTDLPDGNWWFASQGSPTVEFRSLLISSAKASDGNVKLDVVAQPPVPKGAPMGYKPPTYKLSKAAFKDGLLTFTIEVGTSKTTFEGKLDAANADRVIGSQGDDSRVSMANLTKTESTEFTAKDQTFTLKAPDDYKDAQKLKAAVSSTRGQLQREKDAAKKDELKTKLADAEKEADEKVPGLLKTVFEKDEDATTVYLAGVELLSEATKLKAKPDEVATWVERTVSMAGQRGPRYAQVAQLRTTEVIVNQDGFPELALKLSAALVGTTAKAKTAKQVQALKLLALTQKKTKKTDDLKMTMAKIDQLELVLDAEYKKDVPPFKVEKFAGRKDKSANRVAVLELFTGATCPPCVAADVAFDALEQAYTPKDVVLIQYHMHIPGPDPMTNADTQARWSYYGKLFPQDMRGVPSSVFSGKPKSGGGGGMANSKEKYEDFQSIVTELLDEKTDLKIDGSASRKDDTISVTTKVTGLDKPTDSLKVRVLLVEEEIRYPGSNGIRFHHQVARSLFGEPKGWAMKDLKNGEVNATLKLDELKATLNKSLSDYEKERSTTFADKPMSFAHLKVIVLVQDDDSGEILQAARIDVK